MQFISNQTEDNHERLIRRFISDSNEIYIAVAFLKASGLRSLLAVIKKHVSSGKKITVIAGQNFGLTEPDALRSLKKLFSTNVSAKLFLADASNSQKIFHPKIYLFKNNRECRILIGSANFTQGGFSDNNECSIIEYCKPSDEIWEQSLEYFRSIQRKANAATFLEISKYETYYKDQKPLNKRVKPTPPQNRKHASFDYPNLLKHLKNFNKEELEKTYQVERLNYKDAREVLNEIALSKKLTKERFVVLLDELAVGKKRYWNSGSLHRHKEDVYDSYREFRELVRYIKSHKNDKPSKVFATAKEMVTAVDGAAVNYVTEIMMTFNPGRFANINRNPITVLRDEAGVSLKKHTGSFNGDDYENYCDLVAEIASKLKFRDMIETDNFFDKIYRRIKSQ